MDLASPWLALALGLLLVLTPVPVFFASKVKYRSIENLEIARRNGSWWRVWRKILFMPGHWIELARCYLGMRCLLNSLEVIRARGTYPGFFSGWMVAGIALGAATLALCLMLAAFRSTEGALAPVAFVSAAVFAVMPVEVGSLALILAVSTMMAFKSLFAFFAMLALGLAGLGLLFRAGDDRRSVRGGICRHALDSGISDAPGTRDSAPPVAFQAERSRGCLSPHVSPSSRYLAGARRRWGGGCLALCRSCGLKQNRPAVLTLARISPSAANPDRGFARRVASLAGRG